MNIGGPAIQAITLTRRLEPLGFRTLLVRGVEDPDEGSMDDLAARLGVRPLRVAAMRRDVGRDDVRAFGALARALRRFDPHLVHTHAAKAGTLGRAVALTALADRRPVLVHTYHGHSLSGYWSGRRNAAFTRVEQVLGRSTDHLVAVSQEVRAELQALGIHPRETFHVVPLGLDLSRFAVPADEQEARRRALRDELEVPQDVPVVVLVARLVPIKRVDRFLRIAAMVAAADPATHFVVVGDGELREELHRVHETETLRDRLHWPGFRRDMPDVLMAADVVVQTSDNEGTPVSLIEAAATGRPAVTTDVGGSAAVVLDGRTGHVVARADERAFATRVVELLETAETRRVLGTAAREHVLATFALDRLVDDLAGLYRDALAGRRA
ncbi:MAG: glycosyltransferase [Actinomycetota bacterium]|nr:glycosyltransferase [Actinomycetota bacterium]